MKTIARFIYGAKHVTIIIVNSAIGVIKKLKIPTGPLLNIKTVCEWLSHLNSFQWVTYYQKIEFFRHANKAIIRSKKAEK